MLKTDLIEEAALRKTLLDFIGSSDFVCVGAKAAMAKRQIQVMVCRDITSAWDDLRIYTELFKFVERYRVNPRLFQSFAVVFEQPSALGEKMFEAALWDRAQSLSDKDAFVGNPYDQRVSANPDSPDFSLSFAGEAFFIVGLHPQASRLARRFERPTLVFNLHDQFERLRAEGSYERMRETILERDKRLTGSVNPMLARHGESSEARQYSGRQVGAEWKCPFDPDRRALYEG
jgi:FPC/CPF motif-containing protein YcgG